MIVSMTGFAAVAAELPGLSLAVELRSVNHRYLDITLKLPDELRSLEPALREQLAAQAKRGKVECRVALNRIAASAAQVAIDQTRVRGLAQAAAEIRQLVPIAVPLSTAEILRWPGVLVEPSVPPEALAEALQRLIAQGLVELAAARAREGAKLQALLVARCADIEAQIARVAPRIPALHSAFVEKLGTRLKEAGLDANDDRLKQELALFATKIDIAEEVARLSTHVTEVRRECGQASGFSGPGAASRGEHAGVQVRRRRAVASVARAQSADRADARASAK